MELHPLPPAASAGVHKCPPPSNNAPLFLLLADGFGNKSKQKTKAANVIGPRLLSPNGSDFHFFFPFEAFGLCSGVGQLECQQTLRRHATSTAEEVFPGFFNNGPLSGVCWQCGIIICHCSFFWHSLFGVVWCHFLFRRFLIVLIIIFPRLSFIKFPNVISNFKSMTTDFFSKAPKN